MKRRFIIMLSIFGLLPVLIFSLFSLTSSQKMAKGQADVTSLANASTINGQIQSLLNQDVKALKSIASDPVIRAYNSDNLQTDIKPILAENSSIYPELLPIILVDSKGTQLVKSDSTQLANVSDRDYFQAVLKGKDYAISDVLISKGNGHPIILLAAPVQSADKKSLLGVVTGTIDLSKLDEFVHGRDHRVRKCIVRDGGRAAKNG